MSELKLRILSSPSSRRGYIAEICEAGGAIMAVGGTSRAVTVLASSDGEHFWPRTTPARGLRDVCVDGDEVVIVGEYGLVARSADHGATWRELTSNSSGCLFSALADAERGVVWICGDAGYLAEVRGDSLQRKDIGVSERLSAVARGAGALWLLGYGGGLYRFDGEQAREVMRGPKGLTSLVELPSGTLLISGDGGQLYRSSDGGESFARVELEIEEDLEAVAVTRGGVAVLLGGGATLWVSSDDGVSFTPVDHGLSSGTSLWTACPFGDGLLLGGDEGLIAYLGAEGASPYQGRPDRFWQAKPLEAILSPGPEGFLGERLRAYIVQVNPELAAAPAAASQDSEPAQPASDAEAAEGVAEASNEDSDDESDEAAQDEESAAGEDAWQAAASRYAGGLWSGSCADYEAVWGLPPPPELVAFEQAVEGANLYSSFHELRLDVSLLADPPPEKNLFEMLILGDQLNYLGTGLPEVFGGVTCFGLLGNGDTYHLEVAQEAPERPRAVVFWDHEEHRFSHLFADSLESLVYLSAVCHAADDELISTEVAAQGYRALSGKVAPSWHFSMKDRAPEHEPYEPRGEADVVRYLVARASWMIALFRQDGVVQMKDVASRFYANLNPALTPEVVQARLTIARGKVPTALYSMWRAFFFDEPELEQWLEVGRAHRARLARDAARLIDELRAGRNQLGKIGDVGRWLSRFRALDLDPRRAAARAAEAEAAARVERERTERLRQSLADALSRGTAAALLWSALDAATARPALWQATLATPAHGAARAALEYLARGGYSYDNSIYREEEYAACRLAAELADGAVQALLVGEALWPAPRPAQDDEDEAADGEAAAPVWVASHHAWHVLVRIARLGRLAPEALAPLRAALEVESFEDRVGQRLTWVASVLGEARDRGCVPALVRLLERMPAEGEFETALKYDDLIGKLAATLRQIGDPAGATALARFAASRSLRMRHARIESSYALARLAPATGPKELLTGALELCTKINNGEENARALVAYGLVAAAQPESEHAALAQALRDTEPMASSYVEVQLAKAVALRSLGQPPTSAELTVATLLERSLTEPAWKEEYTVRRCKWALEMFELAPEVPAALLAPALALRDEDLTDALLPVLRAHGVAAEPPRQLTVFAAAEASAAELVALVADEELAGRHFAARELARRGEASGRAALELAAAKVAERAPQQPGADLPGGEGRLLTECVRALRRLPEAESTLALFAQLLSHPNRDVKGPVLRDPPAHPSLAAAMRKVAAEKWGWQESTAREWLEAHGRG